MCLQEEAAASNWQVSVLVSPAKWLALLLCSFLLGMYLTKITGRWQGLIRIFCSVYMSLQSDSLPSASFDHTTALGEKKRSGWAFKALSSSWELCLSLACCCTSQSWAKGKQGMPYVQKDPSLTLLAKVTTLWRYLFQTPHQCQLECKIHMDTSKPAGAHFLSKGSSKLLLILFLVPQDRDSCLCLPRAITRRMPFVMGAI